jgi:hypothetical protein
VSEEDVLAVRRRVLSRTLTAREAEEIKALDASRRGPVLQALLSADDTSPSSAGLSRPIHLAFAMPSAVFSSKATALAVETAIYRSCALRPSGKCRAVVLRIHSSHSRQYHQVAACFAAAQAAVSKECCEESPGEVGDPFASEEWEQPPPGSAGSKHSNIATVDMADKAWSDLVGSGHHPPPGAIDKSVVVGPLVQISRRLDGRSGVLVFRGAFQSQESALSGLIGCLEDGFVPDPLMETKRSLANCVVIIDADAATGPTAAVARVSLDTAEAAVKAASRAATSSGLGNFMSCKVIDSFMALLGPGLARRLVSMTSNIVPVI